MLKHLPPLLTPDALHALASMGHGDVVAIVDTNFPAARIAAAGGARLVQLPGCEAPQVLSAVLAVLPVDDFEPGATRFMHVVGDAQAVPPAVRDFQVLLREAGQAPAQGLERHAFYEASTQAFVILRSGDVRPYANLLVRKGVVKESAP